MAQKLLEGEIMETDPTETDRLRAAVDRLTRERDALREENADLHRQVNESTAPLNRIRQALQPLYSGLQAVFGDLDSIPQNQNGDSGDHPAVPSHVAAAWEEWKVKMRGAPASIITALQKHGSANTDQLMILIGTPRRKTIADAVYKLKGAGLIEKSGDQFSLKKL